MWRNCGWWFFLLFPGLLSITISNMGGHFFLYTTLRKKISVTDFFFQTDLPIKFYFLSAGSVRGQTISAKDKGNWSAIFSPSFCRCSLLGKHLLAKYLFILLDFFLLVANLQQHQRPCSPSMHLHSTSFWQVRYIWLAL